MIVLCGNNSHGVSIYKYYNFRVIITILQNNNIQASKQQKALHAASDEENGKCSKKNC